MTIELTTLIRLGGGHMTDAIVYLDWSTDGQLLSVAADGSIAVDGDHPVEEARYPAAPDHTDRGGVTAACWSGPSRFAVGHADGTMALFHDHHTSLVRDSQDPLTALIWSGSSLVSACGDNLHVRRFVDDSVRTISARVGHVRAVGAVTPSYLAAIGADGVALVDIGLAAVDTTVEIEGGIAVAVDRRRGWFAIGDIGGCVHILRHGREDDARELAGYPDRIRHLVCAAERPGVVVASDDELTFWPIVDGEPADEPISAIGHHTAITALAASPTDHLIASADDSGRICLWSLRDLGGPVWTASGKQEIAALAWRHDGTALAAGTVDGAILSWLVTPGIIA